MRLLLTVFPRLYRHQMRQFLTVWHWLYHHCPSVSYRLNCKSNLCQKLSKKCLWVTERLKLVKVFCRLSPFLDSPAKDSLDEIFPTHFFKCHIWRRLNNARQKQISKRFEYFSIFVLTLHSREEEFNSLPSPSPEPVIVNLLRSPGIDSQSGRIASSESTPGFLKRLQIRAQSDCLTAVNA